MLYLCSVFNDKQIKKIVTTKKQKEKWKQTKETLKQPI